MTNSTSPRIERKEVWDPDAYILEVEIDGVKLKFQSPEYNSMYTIGITLLARTFGRYNAEAIRKELDEINKSRVDDK